MKKKPSSLGEKLERIALAIADELVNGTPPTLSQMPGQALPVRLDEKVDAFKVLITYYVSTSKLPQLKDDATRGQFGGWSDRLKAHSAKRGRGGGITAKAGSVSSVNGAAVSRSEG